MLSVFMSNHVDLNSKLHFYSCLVLSRLTGCVPQPPDPVAAE